MSWDQDDGWEFQGDHALLRNGYSSVIDQLAEGLEIKESHEVLKVQHDGAKAVVTAKVGGSEIKEYRADAVIVTVSLGVLKANVIDFSPPLPQAKQNAIRRLGFGLLNKLVLEFETCFWDAHPAALQDTWGMVHPTGGAERGQFYMVWNIAKVVNGTPILVVLCAGQAAHDFEKLPDKEALSLCMGRLRETFGADIPDPINYCCTKWKADPYARGTYSYVGVGASGADYDELAKTVGNTLFFAGEATNKYYPATVPGLFEHLLQTLSMTIRPRGERR